MSYFLKKETIYYERMMFVYIIPSYTKIIDGKEMKLVIGGVKAITKTTLIRVVVHCSISPSL
ncbi:MAG: DUF3871 family protein [Saprospiraceae bacterium]|nr:DUF3871 family protein [Saprospiraceae bacterium]